MKSLFLKIKSKYGARGDADASASPACSLASGVRGDAATTEGNVGTCSSCGADASSEKASTKRSVVLQELCSILEAFSSESVAFGWSYTCR